MSFPWLRLGNFPRASLPPGGADGLAVCVCQELTKSHEKQEVLVALGSFVGRVGQLLLATCGRLAKSAPVLAIIRF